MSLDSFVFIDDNPFEIDLIKNKIPEIQTFLVPKDINNYPLEFIKLFNIFDLRKTNENFIEIMIIYKILKA